MTDSSERQATSTLPAAIEYARAGYRVFPLRPGDKRPLHAGWKEKATRDVSIIEARWKEHPEANVGVLCGEGLMIVDVDDPDSDAARGLGIPETPTVKTGSGFHYYLRVNGPVGNRVRALPGIDVKGDGGYVVGVGSLHPNGTRYTWNRPLSNQPPAQTPAELLDRLSQPSGAEDSPDAGTLPPIIPDGSRNDTLFRHACWLRGRCGLEPHEVLARMETVNQERCQPPLDAGEIKQIVRSACKYEPGDGDDHESDSEADDEPNATAEWEPEPVGFDFDADPPAPDYVVAGHIERAP